MNVNDRITIIKNSNIWYKNFSRSIGIKITNLRNDTNLNNMNNLTHLELHYCNWITNEVVKNLKFIKY